MLKFSVTTEKSANSMSADAGAVLQEAEFRNFIQSLPYEVIVLLNAVISDYFLVSAEEVLEVTGKLAGFSAAKRAARDHSLDD